MNTPRKNAAEFDEFVLRQQSTEIEAASVDWCQERDQWLDYLNVLYTAVEAFLKPYIDGGTIAISYKDVLLNEENIGEYTARQMVLQIGKQHVVFTPIGTLLIGTKGRVDVEGAAGKARLILADRDAQRPQIKVTVKRDGDNPRPVTEPPTDIDWTWKIATMPPQVSYIDLTQDSLFELVMEVANG
ncbi:hypothetical protein [Rhizobium sp. CECT 9324]|uniref:hypothetical protein n=1 Tax=Rhizobium sp. CECT 9324 TaxID=2845820 RepID=UPI001E408361|nr:hypothetical protein [Rhizobium sp. CECT 9324]CAH0341803.1 hypothetical protein RHI9324_03508 [Rhizobium sp. CECT 9324]